MLQHILLKTAKQIEMNLKCSVKKNVKIQEIFPSRLANSINKLVLRTHLFIGFAINSREIFSVSESQCGLISIYFIGKHIRSHSIIMARGVNISMSWRK